MTTKLERFARAEKRAEKGRAEAEAEWRARWWDTTLELAARQDRVPTILAEAKAILGQNTEYLRSRRSTGAAFFHLEVETTATLPPRQAMELVARGVEVDDEAVALLQQDEKRSLRDLARGLGEVGPSWHSKEQRQDPVNVGTAVRALPVKEQARLAGDLLDNPDVQQELIAPGKPRPAPQRDRDPVGGGGGGQRGIIGQKQDVLAWMELSGAIGKAGVILWKALQEWNRGDLGPEAVDHLNELLDELDRRSTIFRQAINAKVDEGELDAILKGGE